MKRAAVRSPLFASLAVTTLVTGCVVGENAEDDRSQLPSTIVTPRPWQFAASLVTGGGGTMQVAVNPANDSDVAVGGDCWGVWRSPDGARSWAGASEPSGGVGYTGLAGTFSVYGLGYSVTDPNVVYAVTGRYDEGSPTDGSFLRIEGRKITENTSFGNHVTAADPDGPGTRNDHPRANNRLVVTKVGGAEHIFVASGSHQGIWHSSTHGDSFLPLTRLGSDSVYTGSAFLDGALIVTTRDGRVVRCADATTSGAVCSVSRPLGLTTNFEDVKTISGNLYAAARTQGVWRSTDGISWSPWGALPSTMDWVIVGGRNNHVFVGCVASGRDTSTCLQSANGADATPTWTPRMRPADLHDDVFGSGEHWWYAREQAGGIPGGAGYYVADIEASTDGSTVYVVGRGGVWRSADAGASWHPATSGLQGWIAHPNPDKDSAGLMRQSQAFGFDAASGLITVGDYDFGCETSSAIDEHFTTHVDHIDYNHPGCSAAALNVPSSLTARCDDGKVIRVVAPTAAGDPAKFLVSASSVSAPVDLSDAYFRATAIKPEAVLCKRGWAYISFQGGGVMTAHP